MNKIKRLEVRYAWIEASLRYSGHFDKVSYSQNFAINAPQISADQAEFVRAFNYEHAHRERKNGSAVNKPYLSIEKGKISILRSLPDEPVFDAPGLREWLRTLTTVSYVETLQFCSLDPDPDIFRQICFLIMREKPCKFSHGSEQTAPNICNVSPHSILDARGRLYVRAFNHGSARYQDFLISEIIAVDDPDKGIRYQSAETDADWHEEVEVAVPTLRDGPVGADLSTGENRSGAEKAAQHVVNVPRALSRYIDEKPLENA